MPVVGPGPTYLPTKRPPQGTHPAPRGADPNGPAPRTWRSTRRPAAPAGDGAAPRITAVPAPGNEPSVWLLGSSWYSARLAGALGLPFAFAHHFSAENTLPALALSRASFRPSARLDRPYAMVAAAVVCAETDERARWLAAPGGLSFLRLRQGRPGTFPSPEEAVNYPLHPAGARDRPRLASHIIGSPKTVRRRVVDLLERTQADGLIGDDEGARPRGPGALL